MRVQMAWRQIQNKAKARSIFITVITTGNRPAELTGDDNWTLRKWSNLSPFPSLQPHSFPIHLRPNTDASGIGIPGLMAPDGKCIFFAFSYSYDRSREIAEYGGQVMKWIINPSISRLFICYINVLINKREVLCVTHRRFVKRVVHVLIFIIHSCTLCTTICHLFQNGCTTS